MEQLTFPTLQPNDIECRVGNVSKAGKGFSLLLYKNARTDIKYLNQVCGVFGWKREHLMVGDKQFCKVSVFSKELNQWVEKMDCGSESDIEKEKGLSSDCFKRACFSLGLGIELYSAPFIWVNSTPQTIDEDKRKTYLVKTIGYDEKTREITQLEIVDEKTGELVYSYGTKNKVVAKKVEEKKNDNTVPATEEQIGLIDIWLVQLNDEKAEKVRAWLKSKFNVVDLKELNSNDAEYIINQYKLRG